MHKGLSTTKVAGVAGGCLILGKIGETDNRFLVRVFCGNLQRGDGFQTGLYVLVLSGVAAARVQALLLVLASDVLPSCLGLVDRSLSAAAALALAALWARRRGGGDISAGRGRGL